MQFYSVKIRLHGRTQNEVMKNKVSAPEYLILQTLHGDDSLVDPIPTLKEKVDHDQERERLRATYEDALMKLRPAHTIDSIFGKFTKLPEKVAIKDPVESMMG